MNSIHNNGENDKSLNGELDKLSSAYTRLDQDEPPELLDQAILNSAHRAIEKKPHWMKFGWLHGLTTTAVFVLAFSLILNQPKSTQVLEDGLNNNEALRLESGKIAKKQALDVRSLKPESDDFSLEMKTKEEERQDSHQDTPVAAAPMSASRNITPEDLARHSASEVQHTLGAQESLREKRDSLDKDAEISETLQVEIISDEADLMVDSVKVEAAYEIPQPRAAVEPVLAEAESQVSEEPGIEQELLAIIKMKQAGDDQWITELELFKERYPDYPVPDALHQVP
ncbi:MAG: hypothetical protein GY732_23170 [Gammaproteobacteria bacterium]|nr:hypothetical protein [Gammaproteobacteria bacterium]